MDSLSLHINLYNHVLSGVIWCLVSPPVCSPDPLQSRLTPCWLVISPPRLVNYNLSSLLSLLSPIRFVEEGGFSQDISDSETGHTHHETLPTNTPHSSHHLASWSHRSNRNSWIQRVNEGFKPAFRGTVFSSDSCRSLFCS